MPSRWATPIDAKDHFTRQHSEEVAVVAHALALGLGLPPCLADHIHIAGHLHDIGKIGIPDAVLQKPGNLTDAEWELVRLHPQMGADIIRPVNFLAASGVVEMVYYHHERWDGKGYPEGLAGDRIPLGSRIIAVADTLSAMLQDRPLPRKIEFPACRRRDNRQCRETVRPCRGRGVHPPDRPNSATRRRP